MKPKDYARAVESLRHDMLCDEDIDEQTDFSEKYIVLALNALDSARAFLCLADMSTENVVRTTQSNVVMHSRRSVSSTKTEIECPFCETKTVAVNWSLAGVGKRCPNCRAIHNYDGTTTDKGIHRPRRFKRRLKP